MSSNTCAAALAVLSATTTFAAVAQSAASTPRPTSASAPLAAASAYHSILEGYRPFNDQQVLPWREANDAVMRAGGWRAYAREAQAALSDDRTSSPPSAKPASAAGGHAGHTRP